MNFTSGLRGCRGCKYDYFDVLLDNACKVEQKAKYKSDSGITG